MKIIRKGDEKILGILGEQEVRDLPCRPLRYLLQAQCPDGTLLYNVLTGQLVLLEEEEALFFRKEAPRPLMPAAAQLAKAWFLVPESYEERNTVHVLRKILRMVQGKTGITGYTILPTTGCNARCFYCYENGLEKVYMAEDLAGRLVEYMIRHKGEGPLRLHWFGGEPLVGMQRIDQICSLLTEKGTEFTSAMTSNGFLFTEEVVKKAVGLWKLGRVQITLDGTEEIYNRTKAYVCECENPYRQVLQNIRRLLENHVFVTIRLNLDLHNMEDLRSLVLELKDVVGGFQNVEVYSHVLFENAGAAPIGRTEETRKLLYRKQVELDSLIFENGMSRHSISLPVLKTHNCMADTKDSVVVYPDGRLFKCEHVEKGDDYGHLDSGLVKREITEKFYRTAELPGCGSCPIYPSCILLEYCRGITDKNPYTCRYRADACARSLPEYYEKAKERKKGSKKESKKESK